IRAATDHDEVGLLRLVGTVIDGRPGNAADARVPSEHDAFLFLEVSGNFANGLAGIDNELPSAPKCSPQSAEVGGRRLLRRLPGCQQPTIPFFAVSGDILFQYGKFQRVVSQMERSGSFVPDL